MIREGCGAGHGIDVDLGQAHESALKEAETDAMKRALMTFGNPFGLALYDKRQREVTGAVETGDGPEFQAGKQRQSLPAAGGGTTGVQASACCRSTRWRRYRKLSHPSQKDQRRRQIQAWRPSIQPPSTSCATRFGLSPASPGGVHQGVPQAVPGAPGSPHDR